MRNLSDVVIKETNPFRKAYSVSPCCESVLSEKSLILFESLTSSTTNNSVTDVNKSSSVLYEDCANSISSGSRHTCVDNLSDNVSDLLNKTSVYQCDKNECPVRQNVRLGPSSKNVGEIRESSCSSVNNTYNQCGSECHLSCEKQKHLNVEFGVKHSVPIPNLVCGVLFW